MPPVRAPTMRSVPEMVSAKLCRAPVRTFSTPSSSVTLTAIASTVRHAVNAAVGEGLQGEARDDHAADPSRVGDLIEASHAIEAGRESFVVAHHDQRRARRRSLSEQEIEKGLLPVAVQRGGRLVGDDEFRAADERARGGDALLLTDAQARSRFPLDETGVQAQAAKQTSGFGVRAS